MMDKIAYDALGLPDYMWEPINEYVNHGIPQGSFLMALLCGDLFEAAGRADRTNIHLFPEYATFFNNEVPSTCFGSKEKVEKWILDKSREVMTK